MTHYDENTRKCIWCNKEVPLGSDGYCGSWCRDKSKEHKRINDLSTIRQLAIDIRSDLRELKKNIKEDSYWDEFVSRFEEVELIQKYLEKERRCIRWR